MFLYVRKSQIDGRVSDMHGAQTAYAIQSDEEENGLFTILKATTLLHSWIAEELKAMDSLAHEKKHRILIECGDLGSYAVDQNKKTGLVYVGRQGFYVRGQSGPISVQGAAVDLLDAFQDMLKRETRKSSLPEIHVFKLYNKLYLGICRL